jgi:probable rRNA maturation factor
MTAARGRRRRAITVDAITVEIDDRQRAMRVSATSLQRLVRKVLAFEGIASAEIGIRLVGDRSMAGLNRRWLGHEGPTDVITFPLSDETDPVVVGDIVVSTETARRVAGEFGWQARHELAYYVVHGLLHLAGYDDRAPADRRAMRARERLAMRAAGLPAAPRATSSRKA